MWRRCTKGWTHDWEKWHARFGGSAVDVRRCMVCGLKQHRWTEAEA